jgi:inhibitor of cysteine peptidase
MADKLIRTAVVMSFFLVMAFFSSCGTNRLNLTDSDNGKRISATTADVIALTLESNPTTGYSWQVMEINNAVLVQDGDPKYKSDGRSIPGSGGTETFRFKVTGTGETTLKLGYIRPWESVPPIETFSVQIAVQ